jgi:hypothetical protein
MERGKYIGNPPTSRFGHTSTAIGPHLLIFGGWEYTKAQNEIIVLRECTNKLGVIMVRKVLVSGTLRAITDKKRAVIMKMIND